METPENFRYTVVINQKALVGIAPNINFEEAAILNYIQQICSSSNDAIDRSRVDGYTWISYSKLIHDMPLLKAKSQASLVSKIKKLESYGLIITMVKNHNGGQKKYFMIPEQIAQIINKNGDGEFYKMFLSIGMNETQAVEAASNHAFIKSKKQAIKKALNNGEIEEPAAYIWHTYLTFTGKEY